MTNETENSHDAERLAENHASEGPDSPKSEVTEIEGRQKSDDTTAGAVPRAADDQIIQEKTLGKRLYEWWVDRLKFNEMLLLAAGVDYRFFRTHEHAGEKVRLKNQGIIVLMTAVFAFLGALYATYEVFSTAPNLPASPVFFSIVFAVAWGTMIFAVDRAIVVAIGDAETKRDMFLAAIPRLVAAIVIGYVISHPIKLALMNGPIESVYNQERISFFSNLPQQAQRERTDQETALTDFLDSNVDFKEVDQLNAALKNAIEQSDEYDRYYDYESTSGETAKADAEALLPSRDQAIKANSISVPYASNSVVLRFGLPNGCDGAAKGQEIISAWSAANPRDEVAANNFLNEHIRSKSRYVQGRDVTSGYFNCHVYFALRAIWGSHASDLEQQFKEMKTVVEDRFATYESRRRTFEVASAALQVAERCKEVMTGVTVSSERELRSKKRGNEVSPLEEEKLASIDQCASNFEPYSYVTRTALLGKITNSGSDKGVSFKLVSSPEYYAWVSWGIVLLFVIIEVLPVSAKLSSPTGAYDDYVAKERTKYRSERQASRDNRDTLAIDKKNRDLLKSGEQASTKIAVESLLGLQEEVRRKVAEIIISEDPEEEKHHKIWVLHRDLFETTRMWGLEPRKFKVEDPGKAPG